MLLGDMQDWKPNVASIIEYAADIYPESEVVSKLVSGEVHRTNYREVCVRSRKLASKLSQDGYKQGDVIATLALNTFRHLKHPTTQRNISLNKVRHHKAIKHMRTP